MNLLETIQQNLDYPILQKIDTTTDKIVEDNATADEHKFSQAAIPAILTALYKYVQTDDRALAILKNESDGNWVSKIFDEHTKEAIEIIAGYAK